MGARRYEPDDGRFLQQDFLRNAGEELELSTDAANENRYGFAGGNPGAFVEGDGHAVVPDGGGGGTLRSLICRTRTLAQREKCAFGFFVRRGLSRAQAAGCVGNLRVESGYPCKGVDPKCWQCSDHSWHNSNCGVGIAQWTYYTRKERLLAFAGGSQARALTLRVQLGFVWRELKTGKGPYNPRAYIHLKRVHGANRAAVYRATDVFMYEYENPGVLHQRERRQAAWNVFRRYGRR